MNNSLNPADKPIDLEHDIKNHLTVILSYANLLEMWKKSPAQDPEKFEKYIGIIKQRVETLTALSEQIPD